MHQAEKKAARDAIKEAINAHFDLNYSYLLCSFHAGSSKRTDGWKRACDRNPAAALNSDRPQGNTASCSGDVMHSLEHCGNEDQ